MVLPVWPIVARGRLKRLESLDARARKAWGSEDPDVLTDIERGKIKGLTELEKERLRNRAMFSLWMDTQPKRFALPKAEEPKLAPPAAATAADAPDAPDAAADPVPQPETP